MTNGCTCGKYVIKSNQMDQTLASPSYTYCSLVEGGLLTELVDVLMYEMVSVTCIDIFVDSKIIMHTAKKALLCD